MLALLVLIAAAVVTIRNLHEFLAVTSPVGSSYLVVEGWMPVSAYREAADVFRAGGYSRVIAASVVQEEPDTDGILRPHSGAEKLVNFGIPEDAIVVVSHVGTQRDRTFHGALAVNDWFSRQNISTASVDVVTVGAHARRSRLLYEKALGSGFNVGVISVRDQKYDADHWWRTSAGARMVIAETIAYVYARVLLSPPW